MDTHPLVKKMKLKPGARAAVINAPAGYLEEFKPLPEWVTVANHLDGKFDWIQVFAAHRSELDALTQQMVNALNPDGLLWVCFPKGSSKIQTDLTRDAGWDALRQSDLKWVVLISVDPTWSAFCLRPYKPGEAKKSWW